MDIRGFEKVNSALEVLNVGRARETRVRCEPEPAEGKDVRFVNIMFGSGDYSADILNALDNALLMLRQDSRGARLGRAADPAFAVRAVTEYHLAEYDQTEGCILLEDVRSLSAY